MPDITTSRYPLRFEAEAVKGSGKEVQPRRHHVLRYGGLCKATVIFKPRLPVQVNPFFKGFSGVRLQSLILAQQ